MKRVALLIETSRTYGRDLLQGVKQYAGEHGPWSLFVELRDLESKPAGLAEELGRRRHPHPLRQHGNCQRSPAGRRADGGTPLHPPGRELPVRRCRQRSGRPAGRRASAGPGLPHFGVYELDTEPFFVERRNSFVRHLQRRGMTCSALRQGGTTEKPSQWERQQARLIEWIAQLPRPAGIMACTDQLGCWLLDACARTGVRVPEELAVVGVENDETLTAMSTPPLSSVQLDGRRAGYEAARLLDRLMQGSRSPRRPVLIPPVGIRTRQSSDIVAIDDPLLAQAIRLIRQRACEGIHVADVLEAVPLSRSSLERGCREILGRSPNREINRVRLQSACELLRETDLNLEQIALRTGFTTPQYLVQLFRRSMGTTPGVYRRQSRP